MREDADSERPATVPALAALAVVALAGAEVVWTWTSGVDARGELLASSDEGGTEVRTVYGLTPGDLGRLVDAATSDAYEGLVALHPGADRLDGPMLTRADTPRDLLPRSERKEAEIRPLDGRWRQIVFPDRNDSTRLPKLRRARVFVRGDQDGNNSPKKCPRIGLSRFSCAPPGWADVRYRQVSVGGSEESCIWVHPLENRTIGIDYGRLAPETLSSLELQTALADKVVGEPGAVRVELTVGDTTRSFDHPPDKRGWRTESLPEPDEPARLEVAISADRVGRRHFCFRLDAS